MRDRLGYASAAPWCAAGFRLDILVPPAALIGANGMRLGPDGRLYVAQAFGSQISAVDTASGEVGIISPAGGAITAPDDLDFDEHGNLYATEVMSARVSAIRPGGAVEVVAENVPVANGITIHAGRIYMSEFRPGGRILELSPNGGVARVVADDLMMPNALCLGPDGYLYFPLVPLGEIWRVRAEGGAPERVAGDFAIPTAVKLDADGQVVVTESGAGAVTRLDPVSGARQVLGRTAFGIDNLAFGKDGELFVSHFTNGGITRLARGGVAQIVVPGGLLGPYGMTLGPAGELIIADGMSLAVLPPGAALERPAMLLQHGFPGYVRGVASAAGGALLCTNSAGLVTRYVPGQEAVTLAAGLDRAMDILATPDGGALVAEGSGVLAVDASGAMHSLAGGLSEPAGLCAGPDGWLFVSEAGAGRVTALRGAERQVVASGFLAPHGLAWDGRELFVLDQGARTLHGIAFGRGQKRLLATGLPVGAGPGRHIAAPPGIADLMPGPLCSFAALQLLPDGRLAVGCDGDGSLRVLTSV